MSSTEDKASSEFDIEVVTTSFQKCSEAGLSLDDYNDAYNELYKFFLMLGTVFGFIASDVREKIDILANLRLSEEKEKFEQVETMMLHEMEVCKPKKKELTGSRTFLRLHRALKFVMEFIDGLDKMGDEDKVSHMAANAYSNTLATFHPWLIQKGAKLAMYTLPVRRDLLKKVVAQEVDEGTVKARLEACVAAIKPVYDAVEAMYTKHDLHGLP